MLDLLRSKIEEAAAAMWTDRRAAVRLILEALPLAVALPGAVEERARIERIAAGIRALDLVEDEEKLSSLFDRLKEGSGSMEDKRITLTESQLADIMVRTDRMAAAVQAMDEDLLMRWGGALERLLVELGLPARALMSLYGERVAKALDEPPPPHPARTRRSPGS